jgi:hypothetical protein
MVRLSEGRTKLEPDPEEEELKKTQIGIAGDTPKVDSRIRGIF